MNKPIYYLAQKYTGMANEAFQIACETVKKLREMKLTVFSPILHSHPYHRYLIKKYTITRENYIKWDLEFCEGFLNKDGHDFEYDSGLVMLFHKSAYRIIGETNLEIHWSSKGAEKEYQWAKDNNVRCLRLESFLKGLEVKL